MLEVDPSGRGFAIMQVPPDVKFTAAAVTLEPDGGSPKPTMPLYALGAVP
jgi:anti-sigma-K factor RskA